MILIRNTKIFIACHDNNQIVKHSRNYETIFCNPNFDAFRPSKHTSEVVVGCKSPNKAWSELSAMYYALRNFKRLKYVGFFHYRRYLLSEEDLNAADLIHSNLLKLEKRIFRQLKNSNFEVNVAKKWHYSEQNMNAYEQFVTCHPELEIVLELVGSHFFELLDWPNGPKSFLIFLKSIDYTYPCNLYFGKKFYIERYLEIFRESIRWFENVYDYEEIFQSNKRWIGYISERVFTFYIEYLIHYKKITVRELPLLLLPFDQSI